MYYFLCSLYGNLSKLHTRNLHSTRARAHTHTHSGNPLAHGRWDTKGCVKNGNLSSSTQTVCECTHLTNFAILLSARPLNQPSSVALSLSIIGYIGVTISVIAMLATILALACLR